MFIRRVENNSDSQFRDLSALQLAFQEACRYLNICCMIWLIFIPVLTVFLGNYIRLQQFLVCWRLNDLAGDVMF